MTSQLLITDTFRILVDRDSDTGLHTLATETIPPGLAGWDPIDRSERVHADTADPCWPERFVLDNPDRFALDPDVEHVLQRRIDAAGAPRPPARIVPKDDPHGPTRVDRALIERTVYRVGAAARTRLGRGPDWRDAAVAWCLVPLADLTEPERDTLRTMVRAAIADPAVHRLAFLQRLSAHTGD